MCVSPEERFSKALICNSDGTVTYNSTRGDRANLSKVFSYLERKPNLYLRQLLFYETGFIDKCKRSRTRSSWIEKEIKP